MEELWAHHSMKTTWMVCKVAALYLQTRRTSSIWLHRSSLVVGQSIGLTEQAPKRFVHNAVLAAAKVAASRSTRNDVGLDVGTTFMSTFSHDMPSAIPCYAL